MNKPERSLPQLDPVHDGRHKLRDLPLERESIPYVISLPDQGIGAFVYTWVTKDSKAGSACVAFGPGVGTPIADKIDDIPVPPDANFDDWKVGKLHLKQDLKLKSAHVVADTARFGLDAQFTALSPAYAYSFHPRGCPAFAATDRLEQSGRLEGTLRIDTKTQRFKGTCARDHSWGSRDWDAPQHWKWVHAQTANACLHFWQIQVRGRTELRGYLWRDGLMTEVASVEVDFALDEAGRQKEISVLFTDTAGRKAHLKGEFFAVFPFVPVPSCTLNEGAMRCEIDGVSGAGWAEFQWPTVYLDYLRKNPG